MRISTETLVAAIEMLDGATEDDLADFLSVTPATAGRLCRKAEEYGILFRSEGFLPDDPVVWMTVRKPVETVRNQLLCGEED